MCKKLCGGRVLQRLSLWIAAAALLTSLAPALPRGLLRSELEGSIRKWLVRDSQGLFYLLSPQSDSAEPPGFSLRVSEGIFPQSLDDFRAPIPGLPPVGARDPLWIGSTWSGAPNQGFLDTPCYAFQPMREAWLSPGIIPKPTLPEPWSWPRTLPVSGTSRGLPTAACGLPGPSRVPIMTSPFIWAV